MCVKKMDALRVQCFSGKQLEWEWKVMGREVKASVISSNV